MITLNFSPPYLSPSSTIPKPTFSKFPRNLSNSKKLRRTTFRTKSNSDAVAEVSKDLLNLDSEMLGRVSAAKDADEALAIIEEGSGGCGVVSRKDCCLIISAAFDRGNVDLALSVCDAMRFSFDPGATAGEISPFVQRWRWSRPDIDAYMLLVLGLAASLRVSDALKMISAVSRMGVSPGEEVPFGKVVRCPTCMIAVAVAQPQHGIQA